MINKQDLIKKIKAQKARSAWARGVKVYALELLESYEGEEVGGPLQSLESALLNGAENWKAYSWGGCSLIYDRDIALRLCTPSELRLTRNGDRKPNAQEEWLDCQARALYQAVRLIYRAY